MHPSRQALDSTAYGETRGGAMPSDDPIEGSCYYVRRQPGRLDWGLLLRTLDQQPDEDAWGITQAVNVKQEWHTRGVSAREID